MRKSIVLLAFLLTLSIWCVGDLFAQDATVLSVCEYQETRETVPINSKTNKPYALDERNQEPFDGGSITKDEIRQCLQAKAAIKNHHIVFEDYRDAWQSLAEGTGDYGIPLLIEGGILHANTPYVKDKDIGGINLYGFRDPNVKDALKMTEEERKALRIEEKGIPIAIIRSEFKWRNILIDTRIGAWRENRVHIIFSSIVDFSKSYFREVANFSRFYFINGVRFNDSNFSDIADFWQVRFEGIVLFRRATFNGMVDFSRATFNGSPHFNRAMFNGLADFSDGAFNEVARFDGTNFNDEAIFSGATFSETALFRKATFRDAAIFSGATFSEVAHFDRSFFFEKAYFADMTVSSQLVFDSTTWERRIDFRGVSAKELQWDSTNYPSHVKGVADFREATIASATFKEIRFHDLVDFSRSTFGQYKVQDKNEKYQGIAYSSARMIFDNNTFEDAADFLHIGLNSPLILTNNRFRKTLDLTGTTFGKQDRTAHLCLSYNRINRLVFESKYLGNIRRIDAQECQDSTNSKNPSDNSNQSVEPLLNIYKTLEKAFKDANDQKGLNEAWYLAKVAQRDEVNTGNVWQTIVAQGSWMLGDIPSRYAIDVWRTVSVSITIMVCFYGAYVLYFALFNDVIIFSHLVRGKDAQEDKLLGNIQRPASSDRRRAFRFRPFESLFRNQDSRSRPVIPWWDAAALSIRSFTKLGLGTIYPETRVLKTITNIEWAFGIYMLIHFILAVKNNLPFILPFLGVVH